jgi:hypothetical protein
MSSFELTGPRIPVTEPTRVDKVHPRAKVGKAIRITLVVVMALSRHVLTSSPRLQK